MVFASGALLAAGLVFHAVLDAQQPAGAREGGQGRGGGRGGGGRGSQPVVFDDFTGFTQIFDGKTMKGWEGEQGYWRVEEGALVGETTAANPLKTNTFMIWRGGEPANFDLRVEFRINSTNSGVQYRSVEMPEAGRFVLKGYQADIDFANQFSGMLYEERGRMFLAPRGTVGYVPAEGPPSRTLATLENGEALKAFIKVNDWNQFQVIARGNVLMHVMNGHVMAAVVDDDAKNRSMKGLIGLQLHTGPPMKVEFRNIYLKNLP
jgi:hypothetical protein